MRQLLQACAFPWRSWTAAFLHVLLLLCGISHSVLIAEDVVDENNGLVIEASDTLAQVGSTIQLTCSLQPVETATLYTTENIRWYWKGIDRGNAEVRSKVNGTKSVVTLTDVTVDNSGNYTCCLNVSCISPADVQIRIGWPPRPATNLSCYSYNFHSPTCTWIRGGQGSHLKSSDTLMAREPSSQVWEKCALHPAYCNATNCQSTCMSRLGLWYYAVNTTNDLRYKLTPEHVFHVYRDGTLNPPENIRVRNLSASELQVSWSMPQAKSSPWLHVSYYLQYRWEGDEGDEWKQKEAVQNMKYTLTNMAHSYGLYYIRIRASTIVWNHSSPFSDVASGRTSEDVPYDVENLEYVDHRDNDMGQVFLSWKPLSNKFKQNGEQFKYVITYQSGQENQDNITDVVGQNATKYTINNLRGDHHYNFCIRASNSMGLSKTKECRYLASLSSAVIGPVLGVTIGLVFAAAIGFIICIRVKRSIKKYPKIKPPPKIEDNNRYLPNGIQSGNPREPEVFDDLRPCQLVVDLGPKQPNGPTIFSDIITDGFDIGDKPRRDFEMPEIGFEAQPLLNLKVDLMSNEAVAATDPLLGEREDSSKNDYDEDCVGSPVSVGSGGSYLSIGDDERPLNSATTREGISLHENEEQQAADVVDGLPRLNWRNENHTADDTLRDRDHHEDPDSELKKKQMKDSSGPHPEKDVNMQGATYTGDGSSLGYTKQGLLPFSSLHDVGNSYVQTDGSIPSYSRMGLQDGSAPLATPYDSDHTQPDQSYPYQARSDEMPAEPTLEPSSPPEECAEDGNIDAYVESALPSLGLLLDFPFMQNHGNPLQDIVDSNAQTGSATGPGIDIQTGLSQVNDTNNNNDTQPGQNRSPRRILPSQDQPVLDEISEETSEQCDALDDDIASYAQNALPGLGQLLDFDLMPRNFGSLPRASVERPDAVSNRPANASNDLNVATPAQSSEPDADSEEKSLNYLTLDLGSDEDS